MCASPFDNVTYLNMFCWFKETINCILHCFVCLYSRLSLCNMICEDANSHKTCYNSSLLFVISFRYKSVCMIWWWCDDGGQKGKTLKAVLLRQTGLAACVLHLYSTKSLGKKLMFLLCYNVLRGRRLLFTLISKELCNSSLAFFFLG